MFNFFKNKNRSQALEPTPTAKGAANNANIRYEPTLIPNLKKDHKKMSSIYVEIENAYHAGKAADIRRFLIEFKDLLTGHILKENISLYAYMKYNLKNDPINYELMQSMQKEMGDIGRVVYRFLDKSTKSTAVYDVEFKREFDQIVNALVRRMQNEENQLYSIYTEPTD